MSSAVPPPQYPAAYPPPRKKKPVWPWIVGVLILIPLLLLGGCLVLVGGAAHEIDKQEKKEHTVTYKVTASGGEASITYGANGSSTAETTSSWTKEEKVTGTEIPSLTVMGDFMKPTTITCEILVDGESKDKKQAEGKGSSVTCMTTS